MSGPLKVVLWILEPTAGNKAHRGNYSVLQRILPAGNGSSGEEVCGFSGSESDVDTCVDLPAAVVNASEDVFRVEPQLGVVGQHQIRADTDVIPGV